MAKLLPSMRPKVKTDTFFLPDENGVFFRNNEGSFRMDGRTIYQWIETLIPMLDGEQSLQELTDDLSETQRNHVYHIVEVLYENGYVRDYTSERPHHLPSFVIERYAHQIAFLEAFSDSAGYRFEQYRNEQVLIVGGGPLLTATLAALYETGMPCVSICVSSEDGTDRDRLFEHAAHAKSQDPMATLNEIIEKGDSLNDWERILEPFEGVIYVSDQGNFDRLYSLESICRDHGKHFLPIVMLEKSGLAGPLLKPGEDDGFESVWTRLHQSAVEPQDRKARPQSFTATALLANVAVFELMKSLTGVLDGNGTHQVFLLDLETMEGDWHSFFPHPFRTDGTGVVRDINLTKRIAIGSKRIQTENLLAFFSGITSTVSGVFRSWEEGDLPQLPLSQCLVEVTNPNSGGLVETMASLIGSGITHEEARSEAGLVGLEACAARIWEANSTTVGGARLDAGTDGRTKARAGESLYSGVGFGAGLSVSEAVLRGLSAWLNHQLRIEVKDRLTLAPLRDVQVRGERLAFLWDSLCAIQSQPGIGLGPLATGFPSVWIGVGTLWYGAVATDLNQAFERAIMGVLTAVQNGAGDGAAKSGANRMGVKALTILNPGYVLVLSDELVEFRDLVDVLVLEGQSQQDFIVDMPRASQQDESQQEQSPSEPFLFGTRALTEVQERLRESGLRLVVDELPLHEMFQEGLAGVFAVSVGEEGQS